MMESVPAVVAAFSGELEFLGKLVELGGLVTLGGLAMWLCYRLVTRLGVPFITAQQQIAEAIGGMANSVAGVACAVGDTKHMVSDMVGADRADHREIILAVSVLADEVKRMRERMEEA